MLARALEVSPLNPTARLAMAQLDEPGPEGQAPLRGLGLSRDSVSLAWSARRLLAAGKKETALRLYGRALSAAAGGGLSRTATPRSGEDSGLPPLLLLPAWRRTRSATSWRSSPRRRAGVPRMVVRPAAQPGRPPGHRPAAPRAGKHRGRRAPRPDPGRRMVGRAMTSSPNPACWPRGPRRWCSAPAGPRPRSSIAGRSSGSTTT